MVPEDHESPKVADFINWAEYTANALAGGSSAGEVRGYLKAISKSTWKLVAWLTHASNAVRSEAEIAIEATYNVIVSYSAVLKRFSKGSPKRCPHRRSYKVANRYVAIEEQEDSIYLYVIRVAGIV